MMLLLRKLLPLLPYALIGVVILWFLYSYNNLKDTNRELEDSLRNTQEQLEDIKRDYVRQEEISSLRDSLNTELNRFLEDRHQGTLKFIQQTGEINNEDGSNTLNTDVKRLLFNELKDRGYK